MIMHCTIHHATSLADFVIRMIRMVASPSIALSQNMGSSAAQESISAMLRPLSPEQIS